MCLFARQCHSQQRSHVTFLRALSRSGTEIRSCFAIMRSLYSSFADCRRRLSTFWQKHPDAWCKDQGHRHSGLQEEGATRLSGESTRAVGKAHHQELELHVVWVGPLQYVLTWPSSGRRWHMRQKVYLSGGDHKFIITLWVDPSTVFFFIKDQQNGVKIAEISLPLNFLLFSLGWRLYWLGRGIDSDVSPS